MKQLYFLLSLVFSTTAFAFNDIDSALDFVYDYAFDSTEFKNFDIRPCRVGMKDNDIDTILNYRDIYDNGERIGSALDTFLVPREHYAFFITFSEDISITGSSPLVHYLFLSKTDSSYLTIDTIGVPEQTAIWDSIRSIDRLTKKDAIESISHLGDFYTRYNKEAPSPTYDIYMIEDTTHLKNIDCSIPLRRAIDMESTWNFIIDTYNDTCIYISFGRDNKPDNSLSMDLFPRYIPTQTDFSKVEGFTLVYSKTENSVKNTRSELDVTIYPNPATDAIYANIDDCSLSLFSSEGGILKNADNNVMGISEFPSGLYFLKVSKRGKSATKGVIIEQRK